MGVIGMIFTCGTYKLKLLPRRFWHSKPPIIKDIQVDKIKLVLNFFLDVKVTYSCGKTVTLLGRITRNEVSGSWAIDALSSTGDQVALRIIE